MVENSFQGVFIKRIGYFLEASRSNVEGVERGEKRLEKARVFRPRGVVEEVGAAVDKMWESLFSTFYSRNNDVRGVDGSIQNVR